MREKTTTIAFRANAELLAAIDAKAETEKVTRAEVVAGIVRERFGLGVKQDQPHASVEDEPTFVLTEKAKRLLHAEPSTDTAATVAHEIPRVTTADKIPMPSRPKHTTGCKCSLCTKAWK